ncbi:MAG: hypothetical protein WDZ38_05270 [Balneolaceae bacterium]
MNVRIKIKQLYPICLFCLFLLSVKVTKCQNVMGAKSIAMGQTATAITDSEWSLFSNVAFLTTEQHHVSFYGFRYVGLAEITDIASTANFQSRMGTIGIGIHRYGFHLFNETRFILGYKNSIEQFNYGLSTSYHHISQGGSYGSAGAIGLHLGLGAEITEGLWIGARASNVNQPSYGSSKESLPRELALGFSYKIYPNVLFTTDLVKDVIFPISFRSGIEFILFGSFFARAGFMTNPETTSMGFGYATKGFEINFGLQQHNPLGLSPALDIGVHF